MEQENQKQAPAEAAPKAEKAPKTEKAPKSAEGAKEKLPRTPTAKKRMKQSLKNQAVNRSLKSQVRTAVRTFKENLADNKDLKQAQDQLNAIFSLMDKGQKKNIFKKNKAARVKSTVSKLIQKYIAAPSK